MRVRLQYLLVILLFVLTGMLCREQRPEVSVCGHAAHWVRAGRLECRVFDCVEFVAGTDVAQQVVRLLAEAEFVDGTLTQTFDLKAVARALLLFGRNASGSLAASTSTTSDFAPPPPGGVAYYIYTLGKIRI